jgi:hypothetical protein
LRRGLELSKEAGRAASAKCKHSLIWDGRSGPDLDWLVGIAVAFSYAASKNHIYAMRRAGHVALRRESRAIRDEIILRLRAALHGRRIAHNKLWLEILVQKPNHRGDAVNVVDLVCDAVKEAVGLDDRWFCIRRLDWEVVKDQPRLFIRVGQETNRDCQVCSHCGRVLEFSQFGTRAGATHGIQRVCRDCRREGRQLARAERESHRGTNS